MGLTQHMLRNRRILWIDPETIFWCVSSKKNQFTKEIYKIYENVNSILLNMRKKYNKFNSKPLVINYEIHLTEECNMNCAYCYVPHNYRLKSNKLNILQIEKIIEKILLYADKQKLEKITVTFHGGEPLLQQHEILQIIEKYYKEKRLKFDIQSNGTLINHNFCKEITQYGARVGISIDGRENEHNKYRKFRNGNGSYHKVIEGFKILKQYIKNIGAICTIHNANVSYLSEIVEHFYNLGIHSFFLNPLVPFDTNSKKLTPPLGVLISNYKKAILKQIEINKKNHTQKIFISNVEALLLNILADKQPCVCYETPCGASRSMLVISSNGDVYPCSEFIAYGDKFKLGNIFKDSIDSMLNAPLSLMLRSRHVSRIQKCKECVFKYICCGNCPLSAYYIYNNFYAPPYYCEFYYEIIDFLFTLLFEYGKGIVPLLVSDEKMLRNSDELYDMGSCIF